MKEFALEVKDLNVWIRDKHIIKGISVQIPKAKILAVMGPSGSGKSTMLRAINRLIELIPDARVEGRVVVYGRDVYAEDPYKIRRIMGTVFQTPNPFPHMSIYENVAIGPRINQLVRSKSELDELVRWALEKAMLWEEVKDRLHDPPHRLSGGQQQRLCLARALALKPKLLLLDEPTGNVDPVNAVKIEEALRSLVKELSLTIVLVTHTPQQAVRISDYIAFLYMGKLVEFGLTDRIALNPSHELTVKFLRGEV